MHELYKVKEMLLDELEEYGKHGELNTGSLEVVDKLAHAAKNVCKIIEYCEDDEYSMRDDGMTNHVYSRARGRGTRRDSMGRYSRRNYSRADGNVDTESLRQDIQRIAEKIEQM